MRTGFRWIALAAAGMTVGCLIGIALSANGAPISALSIGQAAGAQAPAGQAPARTVAPAGAQTGAKPMMSEDVFKNIQVLKGISVDDFMGTMGIMSASLGYCCSECHNGAGTDQVKWDFDTPNKITARKMVLMVKAINSSNFGGQQLVTCWTCHRGRDEPVVTPTLDTVYGNADLTPDDILKADPDAPKPDEILDKYMQALGGAQKLATLTSYVATGTSIGFGGYGGGGQVEIFAKAPDQKATYIHFKDPTRGDSTRTFDGKAGWLATPLTVVRRYPLSGGELDGARLDAQMSFPGQIKKVLTNLRASAPTTIDDHDVQVLQGNGPRGLVATLYFDKQTGLLVRSVRYSRSPIGRVPTQVDYADYRDIGNGIKMPFKWTFAWLDGRDAFQLTKVQPNAPIDVTKFGTPPIPAALPGQ
jgi:photosynthetic reaction center cytochrome c subunit